MFSSIDIDVSSLHSELTELANQAKSLKKLLRATWTRPMADEQRKLVFLRRRITDACILRAMMRGRKHLAGRFDDDWHIASAIRISKNFITVAAAQ